MTRRDRLELPHDAFFRGERDMYKLPQLSCSRHGTRAMRIVHMHTCLGNVDSNALLQRCHSERLDNLLGWLCFHYHQFTEHLPLASLRRWLRLHLQHREAWDRELACGFPC